MKIKAKIILSFLIILFGTVILSSCGSSTNDSANNNQSNSSGDEKSDSKNKYTVTWKNFNGDILEIDLNVEDGAMPSYDSQTPKRPDTSSASYTFIGWDKEVVAVTGNVEYTATFREQLKTYTVIWKNYDGEVLETDYNVSYGTMPEYNGATPTRIADNTYTYTFNGWDKTISEVTGNQEYIAVYTNTYKTYTVSISKNIQAAGNISGGGTYHYNDEVVLSASINSGYIFVGWYNGNTEVSKDISYKFNITTNNVVLVAKYASIEKCVVTFEVYASELGIDAPEPQTIIKGETATKPADLDTIVTDEYTITFGGWSKNSSSYSPFDFNAPITSNTTIYAYWIITVNKYTITYKNYNGEILQSSDVEYGTYPSYNGVIPTKPATEDYIYIFKGWDKEVVDVVGLETYTAVFEEKARDILTVTFMGKDSNNEYVKILETQVKEGNVPEFDGEVSDYKYGDYRYTFAGWYPTITNIYENTIYRAQYQSELLPYKINFDIYGGSGAGITSTRIELLSDLKTMDIFNIRKSNYKFVGWECNGIKVLDENGNIINDIDLEEEMTFKALYDESVLLTITYSVYNPISNAKLISTSKKLADMGDTSETMYCKWNTPVDLVADEGTNYTFVGWYLNNSLQSNTLELNYMIWEQDITLEARFKYVKVELDVYSNNTNLGQVMIKDGNSQTWYDSQSKYSYYSLSMTIAAYSTSDAAFLGWYDINNNLVSTDSVYTFNMINVDYKLEAKWDYFKITYLFPGDNNCSNGGTNNPDNPTYYTSNMDNLELYIPSRNGFTFVGWEYNGEIIDEIATSNICHMTLTARWKPFDELSNLRFTWDDSGIYINGIIDKTVTEIIVPGYVTQISNGAFSGCTSLESITLLFVGGSATDNTYLGHIFGASSYSQNSSFVPTSLKEVIISEGCIDIDSYAFYECSSLTRIEISSYVTSIGSSAFYNCSSLENVYYDGTIEEWCNIEFANNNSNPMYYATNFYILDGNGDVEYNGKNYLLLTELVIPNSVTSIGSSAFYNCSSLVNVYYDGTIEEWCNITFSNEYSNPMYYATNLYFLDENGDAEYNGKKYSLLPNELVIHNTITSIGKYAFAGYKGTSIEIPSSVTNIGRFAFYGCSSLESITLPFIGGSTTSNTYLGYIFGASSDSDNSSYVPTSLKEIIISEGCTRIGTNAFRNCSSLPSIEIPSSVTSIGQSAFYGCSSLGSITLPFIGGSTTYNTYLGYIFGASSYSNNSSYVPTSLKEVIISKGCTNIDSYAFYYCSSLIKITIPNTVTSIGSSAFYGCSKLTSITIPNSVTNIGSSAFSCCSSLESITLPFVGNRRHISTDTYQYPLGYIFGTSSYTGGTSTTQYYYGSSTTSTTNTTYYIPSTLKEVIITDCEYIQYGAFYNCSKLTSIVIPNTVTSRGQYLFYNCSSLQNVYYDGTIEEWCNITFGNQYSNPMYYATNLYFLDENGDIEYNGKKYSILPNELVIPNTVTSIGSNAFYNCSSLQNVYYDGTIEEWCNITFSNEYSNPMYYATNLYFLDENGDAEYNGKKYSLLPNELVIPNTITSIGQYAFRNCSKLISITIPNSVTSIGSSAFYNCSKLTSITIPNSVTSIGSSAFYNCSKLTSITIPNSVTSIGQSAFYDCGSLESITLLFVGGSATDNKYLGYIFGASSYSNNSNYVPTSLKEVIISEGCTNIDSYAFCYCSSLTSIIIPNSVTSIGSCAFFGCSSLTSITIPNTVTSIGERAFYNCSKLTSITISNSVTSIGSSAFYNCSSLVNVYYDGIIEEWCNITFSNEYSNPMYYATNLYFLDENGDAEYNGKKYSLLPNELVIPNTITSIGKYAFAGYKGTSITIPNSVTSIGSSAFCGCSSLESITLPFVGNKRHISTDTYQYPLGYIFGTSSYTGGTSTKQYYGSSITSTTNTTFYIPSTLKEVIITDCEYVQYGAFYNCSKLTSITIPNSVTSIGSSAFYHCSSLTSIVIPNSVTSIGSSAFYACSSLESITLPFIGGSTTSNTYLGYIFGASSDSDNSSYVPTSLKEVIISEGCTSIGTNAFYGCSSLTSITIPNSVTSIGSSAFYYCSSLTSITIPNSVESIGTNAFYKCSSLQNVYYNGTSDEWLALGVSGLPSAVVVHCTDKNITIE